MGFIRNWLEEMDEMWDRMANADPTAFIGLPSKGKGTLPSNPPTALSDHQRNIFERCFHDQCGRFPSQNMNSNDGLTTIGSG